MPYVYSRPYVYSFWQIFQALRLFPALRQFQILEYIFFFHLLSDLKPFADSKLVDIVISTLKLLVSQVRIFERRIQNASYDLNENCFCKKRKSAIYVTSLVIFNLDTKEVGYKFQVESH